MNDVRALPLTFSSPPPGERARVMRLQAGGTLWVCK